MTASASSDVISIAILGKDDKPLYIREFISIIDHNHSDNDVNDRHHHQYDDELELLFDLPSMSIGNGTGTETFKDDTAGGGGATAAAHNDDSGINTTGTTTSCTTKCSIRQQFIMHAALDRLEQLAGPPPGYGWRNKNNKNSANTNNIINSNKGSGAGADGMFVGLLCPIEDQRVYVRSLLCF